MPEVQNDIPIKTKKDDTLNRKTFAENIANTIYTLKDEVIKDQGIVIGLNGKWGSGKTSLINMIKETLLEKGYSLIKHQMQLKFLNLIFKGVIITLVALFNLTEFLLGFEIAERILDSFYLFVDINLVYWIFNYIIVNIIKLIIIGIIVITPFSYTIVKNIYNITVATKKIVFELPQIVVFSLKKEPLWLLILKWYPQANSNCCLHRERVLS